LDSLDKTKEKNVMNISKGYSTGKPEDHLQVFQEAKKAGKLGKRADQVEVQTEKNSIPKQCKQLKKGQKHEYLTHLVTEECHYKDACPAGGCLEQRLGLEMVRFHWAQGISVSFKRCNANFEKIKEYIRKELEKDGVKDDDMLEDLSWSAIGSQSLENIHKNIDHEVQLYKQPLKKLPAKEILRLMKSPSGHPDQEGEIYSRFDVINECTRRGKQLLVELGWPTEMTALYWHKRRLKDGPSTLKQIIAGSKFDNCRGTKDIFKKLAMATDFEYDCTHVGLSCTTLKEWQKWIGKHPTAKPLLIKAIEYDKAFYEYAVGYNGGRATVDVTGDEEDDPDNGVIVPLGKQGKDGSAGNLTSIARWLGIQVNKASDVKILTEANPYAGVWHVLDYTPEKPSKQQILQQEIQIAKNTSRNDKPTTLTLDLFS